MGLSNLGPIQIDLNEMCARMDLRRQTLATPGTTARFHKKIQLVFTNNLRLVFTNNPRNHSSFSQIILNLMRRWRASRASSWPPSRARRGCSRGHPINYHRNVQRFRGGLVFKAHRLLYHSTLGLRAIKKKKKDAFNSNQFGSLFGRSTWKKVA